ncbi:MAG: RNA-binding domain-containing protein [Candidatus Paceibacterota bacterium]
MTPQQSKLPLNLEDLLRARTVESDRIEYKAGWNPDAIVRTLCAFANDFENLGGGYVVIGQDCDASAQPVFPPVGLSDSQLESVQQSLLSVCKLIQPSYFPILSIEVFDGKKLIVLWAPGGQNRPYKAPRAVTVKAKDYHYYIRRYSSTVELKANSEEEQELLRLTATIPFDDRQCRQASVDDLNPRLIQTYLKEVGSGLADEADRIPLVDLGRQMNIVDGATEHVRPRNVGILFFHDQPNQFFPGAQIDVVIFPKGPGGGEIIEKSFQGPVHEQIRNCLKYLQNDVIREKIIKHKDRAESTRFFNYPFPALEEVVVNAVYHRSYEQREPVEVRVNPDGIDVVSYPGPDASIRVEALNQEKIVARRYRNRRIGDFLKELDLTEGRCTGIPTIRAAMEENGSPAPRFSTDADRTYFLVELPVHPQLPGVFHAHDGAHDGAHDEAHDDLTETELKVLWFLRNEPQSRAAIAEYLGLKSRSGHLYRSIDHLRGVGLAELTIPDKPQSKHQKMRITDEGKAWLDQHVISKKHPQLK